LAQGLRRVLRAVPHRDTAPEENERRVMMDVIDIHLGRRLRRRRRILGLTQQQLASACGVRFQQIQKYECAANRMSAARLWQLAEVLEVPVSYFYEGLALNAAAAEKEPDLPEPVAGKETKALIRAFYSLSERPRQRLLELAKTLNENEAKPIGHAFP
jgi:transcriptional regulator with XRE-family HTH domain